MSENKRDMDPDWVDPDDAPDLTDPDWATALDAAPIRRGRPKSPAPKVSTTLRLDPDLLEYYRSSGPGWQTRINEDLRKAAGLRE